MKNLIKGVVLTIGLSSIASATVLSQNTNVNDEFTRMQNYMNKIMNSYFVQQPIAAVQNINYPKVDMQEKDDKYILNFELAGMSKDDIKLSLDNNLLLLSGEKKVSKNDQDKRYIKHEIFVGKFQRVIQLPDNINIDKIQSKFKNGILEVTIPKNKVKTSKVKVLQIN
jgi:HSP20 family protein